MLIDQHKLEINKGLAIVFGRRNVNLLHLRDLEPGGNLCNLKGEEKHIIGEGEGRGGGGGGGH